jgi:hypothetical protein
VSNRDNKYARRAKESEKKKNFVRDVQLTVDEQLTRLEDDIRRLKVEFDIFFNGASKRPPYDTKGRVETVIKRLTDDRTLTFAQRYRFNTLVARYNSFLQLWRRTMQGREEGRDPLTAARGATQARRPDGEPAKPHVFVCSDPHSDVPTVRQLFDALVEEKRRCGESVEDLSFPRFHRMIAARADALKERSGCESVKFSVGVHDGRVSLKAKGEK